MRRKAVTGGKVDLVAHLRGDELIRPTLGGFDFRVNDLIGPDLGQDLSGDRLSVPARRPVLRRQLLGLPPSE